MSNGLTVLVLIGLIATIVLVVVVLIRQSGGFDTAAKTVRDELKAGREETQQAAARLREELGVGLKTGNETLVRSLESMGALQQAQLTGMTTQIKELTEASQRGTYQVRNLLDTRVKEMQGMCCNFEKTARERRVGSIRLSLMRLPRRAC